MTNCPICLNLVPKLKTNSHIIPRWAILQTKIKGRNVSIEPSLAKVNQEDYAADIVCEDCEKRFAIDDGIAAQVFRDGLSLQSRWHDEKRKLGLESHSPDFSNPITYFSISVLLRNHLYLKQKNFLQKNLLGPYFEILRSEYLQGSLIHASRVVIVKTVGLDGTCSLPQRHNRDGCTSQEYFLSGYKIFHFLTKKEEIPHPFGMFKLTTERFNILEMDYTKSNEYKNMAKHLESLGEAGRDRTKGRI